MKLNGASFLALSLLLSPQAMGVLTAGQIDDFESGSADWVFGAGTYGTVSGGPGGAGDNYLNIADQTRRVAFNNTQWAGDYVGGGITAIRMDILSLGGDQSVRVAIGNNGNGPNDGGTWWVSDAQVAGSGWSSATFSLEESNFTRTNGSDSFAAVLGNVTALRVLSNASAESIGDFSQPALGVDNITAVPEPGVVGLLAMGMTCLRRHRRD